MKKMTNHELFQFCEHFSLIFRSGMSAYDGFQLLLNDNKNEEEVRFFETLQKDMEEHNSFAYALKHSGVFPEALISYLKVGEETGCLDEVMPALSQYYEQEDALSEHIKNAAAYPLMIFGIMGITISMLLAKVLPVFEQIYRQMGLPLSRYTAWIFHIGSFLNQNPFLLIGILILICVLSLFFLFHPRGKLLLPGAILHLVVFRHAQEAIDYSRMTHGISLGLRSGLDPEYTLSLAETVVLSPKLKSEIQTALSRLKNGELFMDTLTQKTALFQGMEARLVLAGFYSGTVEDVMRDLSKRYQEKSFSLISQAVAVIEPSMIILLSVLSGSILLCVMFPLLTLLTEMM